ncbi:hypothetical protein SAMN04488121_103984 [Chitinophaga filiformis]|uniref:Uncharacterized protein n=1 Tax=Chitinophaga filiformis TaxID=104663 RepID=A0A1G7SRN7_CHIFI|nr:hypothetical protein SAMN04488121_103984 [Chitinophaga filiformis]
MVLLWVSYVFERKIPIGEPLFIRRQYLFKSWFRRIVPGHLYRFPGAHHSVFPGLHPALQTIRPLPGSIAANDYVLSGHSILFCGLYPFRRPGAHPFRFPRAHPSVFPGLHPALQTIRPLPGSIAANDYVLSGHSILFCGLYPFRRPGGTHSVFPGVVPTPPLNC